MRVLIIPDKFKGTLTATAAAEAIAAGWRRGRPTDLLEVLPMSDGGDGFGQVMARLLRAKPRSTHTCDAARRPCTAQWWWLREERTALIESAGVIGLAMLPTGRFHPYQLDTFGLGTMLEAAARAGARLCIVGVGGSATNDGGFGVARACGWEFLDGSGILLEAWTQLDRLAEVRTAHRKKRFPKLLVAADVENPLLGRKGASLVYGPQKGLSPADIRVAETRLRRLARVMRGKLGADLASVPGSGAAGGLGFGLMAFFGAEPVSGFKVFARYAKLDRRLRAANLVITGEGALDASTMMGKGVGEIARRCRSFRTPCIGLAGKISKGSGIQCFTQVHSLDQIAPPNDSLSRPAQLLEELAQKTAESFGRA